MFYFPFCVWEEILNMLSEGYYFMRHLRNFYKVHIGSIELNCLNVTFYNQL